MELPRPVTHMVDQNSVADYLICTARQCGELLTNLKLQKLLYYAQAWHLAFYDEPLFDEEFRAWKHGPVLPTQYRRYRHTGWNPILDRLSPPELPERVCLHLKYILRSYGSDSAIALEQMTHAEPPWREARGNLDPDRNSNRAISTESMRSFYGAICDSVQMSATSGR
jgi:uncharacterized phage-associated protein